MKYLGQHSAVLMAAVLLGFTTADLRAQTAMAQNNATVQPAGPRQGGNGLAFFNVEGVPSGASASFGVLEFNSPDLGYGQVSAVTSLSVTLVQDEASFTSRGAVIFYVTGDTTTSILNDGTSPLMFDPTDPEGLNGQLTPLYKLGKRHFHPIRSGHVDTYTFTLAPSSAAGAYLVNQINSGGLIRIVIAPEVNQRNGNLVGATWAGYTSTLDNAVPLLGVAAQ